MVPITLICKELRQLCGFPLVGRGGASRDAGVVDEAGERPERLRRLVEQPRQLSRVRDIGLESLRPPA